MVLEFTYYKQCLNCVHREVCKYKQYFKEYVNSTEYAEEIDHRKVNFALLELYNLLLIDADEILDTKFLFASIDCPKFCRNREKEVV